LAGYDFALPPLPREILITGRASDVSWHLPPIERSRRHSSRCPNQFTLAPMKPSFLLVASQKEGES
jgi:hypothetical protein